MSGLTHIIYTLIKKIPEINSLFKNKKFGDLLDYLSNYEKN
jgi:hypothetical protein